MTTGATKNLDRDMVRAVLWTGGAKWASQILSWGATIVVARLLSPGDFGLVGMAALYLNLAALISQIGVANAVITLRGLTRRQIAELNTVAVLVGAGLVALSGIVAIPLSRFFATPSLRGVIILVSTTCFINGFQVVPGALLQKELRFELLAWLETLRAFGQIVATIVFALLGFGYWCLVFGYIMGATTATVLTLCFRRHPFAGPHFGQLRSELQFSGQVMLSGIAWYVYTNADFAVAGRVLGQVQLGDYTFAWTISSAPVEKISTLVTRVTPAFFSAAQDDKRELRRYLLRLTEALSYLTVPASIGIALIADQLIPVVLGPKWLGVIAPLQLLALYVAVRSITTLLPIVLTAIRDTTFVMWTTLASAVIMPTAFFIGSHWGTRGIAAAWFVMYPVITAPLYYKICQRLGMTMREYCRTILPSLVASAFMIVAVLLTRWAVPITLLPSLRLSLMIGTGSLAYAGALYAFYGARLRTLFRALRSRRDSGTTAAPVALETYY